MSEWNQRELCSDGACTGVIGPNGTCNTCGRAAPGGAQRRDLAATAVSDGDHDEDEDAGHDEDGAYEDGDHDEDGEDEDEEDEDEEDEAGASPAASARATPGAPAEWNERQLCPNGACVGLIGDNGACRVCGTKAPNWKPVARAAASEDAALAAAAADLAESISPADAQALAPALPLEPSAVEPVAVEAGANDGEPRALCPDGACVGVIGGDGKCKLCGKAAA